MKSLGLTGEIIHEICTTFHRYHTLNQEINAIKIHLLKFLSLENLESLSNQQINSFLHIHLTLPRTSFSNQQINAKKNSPIEIFGLGKFRKSGQSTDQQLFAHTLNFI